MTDNERLVDIHTIATQLTQWHTNTQIYDHETHGTAVHATKVPPLITQLDNADPTNTGAAYRATPASRPPTSLDALDTLTHIDHQSAAWLRKLGHDDPGTTIECVRKVYSLAPSIQFCGRNAPVYEEQPTGRRKIVCCDVHRIERDLRTWWTQARIVSGWDQPAWAPNNTCIACSERRSLRIRVDDQSAYCTNCRETWDRSTIGLLAEHVRRENGDEEEAS